MGKNRREDVTAVENVFCILLLHQIGGAKIQPFTFTHFISVISHSSYIIVICLVASLNDSKL